MMDVMLGLKMVVQMVELWVEQKVELMVVLWAVKMVVSMVELWVE